MVHLLLYPLERFNFILFSSKEQPAYLYVFIYWLERKLTKSYKEKESSLLIIENLGKNSSLRINWDKSQILPLDHFPPLPTNSPLPLHRVSSLKYLGVFITRRLRDYIPLNIEPLYNLVKTKTQIWARLLLGWCGRINLTKIKLLPKILYMMWQAPLYIPLTFFKTLDSILNSFIWGNGWHKLAWKTLKNPTTLRICPSWFSRLLFSFPVVSLLLRW